MELRETKISTEEIFSGRILHVHRDTVRLPNGKTATREVADHPGGVAIVALTEENEVYLVEQFRYAFDRVLLEIPAGKREIGEPPFVTAQRELREEIGAEADNWYDLGTLLPSPGCFGETLYLYMATNLRFTRQDLDEDEFLNVKKMPLNELVARCLDGTVADAKTVCGALKVYALRAEGKTPCVLPVDGV